MNWLTDIPREPMLEQLGWTLVHSVWECAAVALFLAMLLPILRRSESRYFAACASLVTCLTMPVVTFIFLQNLASVPMPSVQSLPNVQALVDVSMPSIVGDSIDIRPIAMNPSLQAYVPFAAVIWLAGVVLLCARHTMGWMTLRRMRRTASPITDGEIFARLGRLGDRLGVHRRIALAHSARVQVPSMIGWLRPMILLPIGALSGLSPQHLEAILAHELAHVRRQDYLANLLQTLIETLLFYHPAVWWISKLIRQEREHCCDDLAVRTIGNAREYGMALAAMEELRSPGALVMAAGGGSLVRRIRRLARPEPRRGMLWPAALVIAVVLGVAACSRVVMPKAQAQQPATEPVFDPKDYIDATAEQLQRLTLEQRRQVAAEGERRRQEQRRPATTRAAINLEPKVRLFSDATMAGLSGPDAKLLSILSVEYEKKLAELRKTHANDHWEVLSLQQQIEQVNEQLQALRAPASTYYISGVISSGMYTLSGNISLNNALYRANDSRAIDADKYVAVIHQFPVDGQKSHVFASHDLPTAGDRFMIRGGDVIMVTDQGTLPPEKRFTLQGKVAKPGFYPLQRNMTLLQAVVAAGVNPPDVPQWRVLWTRNGGAHPPSQANLFDAPQGIPMADLIGGAIGMESVLAGDTIEIMELQDAPKP